MVISVVDLTSINAFESESRKYIANLFEEYFQDQQDIVQYLNDIVEWLDDLEKNCSPYLYRMMPLVFSLDIGIADREFLQKICNVSLLGFIISIVNDRALDEKDREKYPVRWIYISYILYSKYILIVKELNESAENAADTDFDFLQFEREAFIGLFREDNDHFGFQLNHYNWTDVSFRCSQVKTLMVLAARKSNRVAINSVNLFCDKFSFALCLEDDLYDWERDFDNGRFTYAVQVAMRNQNIQYSKEEHEEIKRRLCRILFFSPVYFQIRNEMAAALNECIDIAEGMSDELKRVALDSGKEIESTTLKHISKLKQIEDAA